MDPLHLIELLNQEIPKFAQCLTTDRLSLNTDKTKFMVFKPRQKRLISIQIRVKLNNKENEQVKEKAFLGVVLDENLTWRSYVAHVANKISKSIYWNNLQINFLPKERVYEFYTFL